MNYKIGRVIFWVILFSIGLSLSGENFSFASTKSKEKVIKTKTYSIGKEKVSKKKKGSKKKRSKYIPSKNVLLNIIETLENQKLAEGVHYKKIQFGKPNAKIICHFVEVVIDSLPNKIRLIKAKNSVDQLDYIQNIFDDYQFNLTRIYGGELVVLMNGSFWSAHFNYPIGPLVIDGEVISMKKYKEWSSGFFDTDGRLYIDNFELSGKIVFPIGKELKIDNVNRRAENDLVVAYNKYYGEVLPNVRITSVEKELAKAIEEIVESNELEMENELEIDTNFIRNQIILQKQMESVEFATFKITFRYLESPIINRKTKVEIVSIDTQIVEIPADGFVLSLPREQLLGLTPKVGTVCELFFHTNKLLYIPFSNAISGTPRLVRKSIAKHEAYEEGSRGYRFIGSQLPRSVIGTNMSKTKIFLIKIEANKSNNSLGANLTQLAKIAKKLGCFDAMNLDGGGSSMLLVNGKYVGTSGTNKRRISVAIGVEKF
ncbi:MAG: phosphodiester glycosidase family protein [Ignavibacteria bacterium]|nr:phosphodiester glycosidase family protein [Ignavibacteria bacterium]